MTTTSLLIREKGDVTVASFNEAKIADATSIQQLERDFQVLVPQASSGKNLLVDFSRVEFVSSMTIGLIVRLHRDCKRGGVRLKLCGSVAQHPGGFQDRRSAQGV